MNFPANIGEFITSEETAYKTQTIEVSENNNWNMYEHIRLSFSMKMGKFLHSSNDLQTKQAKRNIILPILRLRYRMQDIDVKEITIYVDDPERSDLSFLIKKYWEDVFLIENDFESFLDRMQRDPIDFGGGLVKKGFMPEVVPLQRIAFCDQTNVLGGPVGLKYNFSPDELRLKAKEGWGDVKRGADVSLETLIDLAKKEKSSVSESGSNKNQITGKNVEVYVVRGEMPDAYLRGEDNTGEEKMVNQLQIVAFYTNEENQKVYQTLYRSKETGKVYKFYRPGDEVFGRALDIGGVEELFDPQMWTDFAQRVKHDMLENASKVLPWTDDDAFASRNKIKDMSNMEWSVVSKGSQMGLLPNASPNIQLFTQTAQEWEEYANKVGGNMPVLSGQTPHAGTSSRLQERLVLEAKGLPEYRKGIYAKFIEEVIRDYILPRMAQEIVKGRKFLTTLTADETQFVFERVSENRAAYAQMEAVLNGKIPEDLAILKQQELDKLTKQGNQHLFEILQDEFKDVKLNVKITIANKQKDLSIVVDKLMKMVGQYLSSPQMMQDPFAMKLMERAMEAAGVPMEDIVRIPRTMPQMPAQAGTGQPAQSAAVMANNQPAYAQAR